MLVLSAAVAVGVVGVVVGVLGVVGVACSGFVGVVGREGEAPAEGTKEKRLTKLQRASSTYFSCFCLSLTHSHTHSLLSYLFHL